jgi:hypothetical protein
MTVILSSLSVVLFVLYMLRRRARLRAEDSEM